MKKIVNNNFKCISKTSKVNYMNREDYINIFKKEFNKYIKNKSLDVRMVSSLTNPILRFEFRKKEK